MPDESMKIVVKGTRAYEGEYPLGTDRAFNAREWNWIKRIAGYMPETIEDGFNGDDPDLYVAFAVIALCREGRIDRSEGLRVAETLAELPFGEIRVIFPQATEDDAPLELTGEPERQSQKSSPEKTPSSGGSSGTSSETPAPTPSPTGTSELGMSAPRRLRTLSAS